MRDLTGIDLPMSVLDLVELTPAEDVLMAVLREGLPDVQCQTLIPEDAPPYFVLARRVPDLGNYRGDVRGFTDFARFFVHSFTSDPDGDEKGALLADAVRVALRNAWLGHKQYPDIGHISKFRVAAFPSRKTDWATSSGPVQFADLPTGYWRYEAIYEIEVRTARP